jgi:hypothetical protein
MSLEVEKAVQKRLIESRQRLLMTEDAIARSLVLLTGQRRIGGGSDGDIRPRCTHDVTMIEVRGSYDESRRHRDEFSAEFSDRYVSPVHRMKTGRWGWFFCPQCPA